MPRNRRRAVAARGKWYSNSQKIEACQLYAATRSPTTVCATYQLSMNTLKSWMKSPWWKEMMNQIQRESDGILEADMTKILKKTLVQLQDRVENGNFVFNQKTGDVQRVPISAREASKVTSDLMAQRKILRDQPEESKPQEEQLSRLLKLAEEFSKFSSAKTIEGEKIAP